jgi:hypothetical protein
MDNIPEMGETPKIALPQGAIFFKYRHVRLQGIR